MKLRLREIRKARGLSQEELGHRLGVEKATVSKWELGRAHPTTQRLEEIAQILGCTAIDLLTDAPSAETEREKAILQLYRGLSPEQQQAFLQLASAVAQPGSGSDEDDGRRPRFAAA